MDWDNGNPALFIQFDGSESYKETGLLYEYINTIKGTLGCIDSERGNHSQTRWG